MNEIQPDREPMPQRRPLGIDWEAVAAEHWPPYRTAAISDGDLAALIGCTRQAVSAARARRKRRPWRERPRKLCIENP